MGKRSAEDELFVGNMGSIQRVIRTSMQRVDKPTMETGLERIAAKARSEPKLRFTSLAHHLTRERVWTNLCQIPKRSAPGVDGQTVTDAKESFGEWVEPVLRSVHRQGYRAPDIRRVYIPKPGKREKRPLGVPCVNDRALQRSAAQVLSAIYEADFLPCSFGDDAGDGLLSWTVRQRMSMGSPTAGSALMQAGASSRNRDGMASFATQVEWPWSVASAPSFGSCILA